MKLPRSTYYNQSKSNAVDDSGLIALIEAIIEEFPGYGYRRVTRELHRRNQIVNHKKVLRIMHERGLTRKTKRRWIQTTDSRHTQRIYPNLIKNLVVTAPNQVWTADITYIGIRSGFVYLAILLDLFARRAIGYSISRNIDTALCLAALTMALAHRKPPRASFITRIGASSTPPMTMSLLSCNMAFSSVCPAKAIPMTTPPRKAFLKHSRWKKCIFGNTEPWKMFRFGFPFSFRKCTTANVCIPLSDTDRRLNLKNCSLKTKFLCRLL